MKAFALTSTDQPASLVDLPQPPLADDAIRVRVRAASVNGFDVFQASGALIAMMPHDLPAVIGRDFAGVVEAVGAARTDVAVGDEIFGFLPFMPPLHDGSFAETTTASNVTFADKPAGVTFGAAAALALAGVAALDAIEAVKPGPGDVVVVVGATGGVGSIVVQLAAQRGATVIATAKAGDEAAFVRDLGASETVDYGAGDVAEQVRALHPAGIDVLIDLVNRDAAAGLAGLVRTGGRLSTTMGSADVEGLAGRDVQGTNIMAQPTPEKLTALAELVASGGLRVEIQETFPLERVQDALAAFGAGTLGKVVLTIE